MTTQPTRAQIDAAKARQTAMRRAAQMHREAARRAAAAAAVRREAERLAAEELRAEASKPTGTTLADLVGYPTLAERDQALALQRNRKA